MVAQQIQIESRRIADSQTPCISVLENITIRWKPSPAEITLIAIVLFGASLLLWPIIKNGPAGAKVHPYVNDSSRRVFCKQGFSIIVPSRWECLRNREETGLYLHPMSPFVARSGAIMVLMRPFDPPNLAGFKKVKFEEFDAWEKMHINRESSFDDPAYSTFELYIDHPTGWILFAYSISKEMTDVPPSIREYIDSIEIDTPSTGDQPQQQTQYNSIREN